MFLNGIRVVYLPGGGNDGEDGSDSRVENGGSKNIPRNRNVIRVGMSKGGELGLATMPKMMVEAKTWLDVQLHNGLFLRGDSVIDNMAK